MDVQIIDCHGYLVEWRYCKGLAAYVALMVHNGTVMQVVTRPLYGEMVGKCTEYALGTGRVHNREG
jgi:hypothetical protein